MFCQLLFEPLIHGQALLHVERHEILGDCDVFWGKTQVSVEDFMRSHASQTELLASFPDRLLGTFVRRFLQFGNVFWVLVVLGRPERFPYE